MAAAGATAATKPTAGKAYSVSRRHHQHSAFDCVPCSSAPQENLSLPVLLEKQTQREQDWKSLITEEGSKHKMQKSVRYRNTLEHTYRLIEHYSELLEIWPDTYADRSHQNWHFAAFCPASVVPEQMPFHLARLNTTKNKQTKKTKKWKWNCCNQRRQQHWTCIWSSVMHVCVHVPRSKNLH